MKFKLRTPVVRQTSQGDLVVFGYVMHATGAILSWQKVGDHSGGFHVVEIPENPEIQAARVGRIAEQRKNPKPPVSLMDDPTLDPKREFPVEISGIGSIGFQTRTMELVLNDSALIDEVCGSGTYERVAGPVERAILGRIRQMTAVLVGGGDAGA